MSNMSKQSRDEFHATLDFTLLDSPPHLDEASETALTRESKLIDVAVGGNKLKIHVEQIKKEDSVALLDVLFLHGASFSSQHWLEIKTLYHVANWGHRAVAIDLPGGRGKSSGVVGSGCRAEFLESVISTLGLNHPVIVSPSASGGYSLPFLFEDAKASLEKASGFVPVAPVGTSEFVEKYKKSQIPTLIVCGTNDKGLGTASTKDLRHLLNAQYAPIEGAGHACYMNNPDAFHKLLYYFLSQLKS